MKKPYILFILMIFGGLFISCKSNQQSKSDVPMEERIEYSSTYVCPMHCEGSGSEEPGECPTCGMDYVLNENVDSGMESDSHEGHDHGDHEGHDH